MIDIVALDGIFFRLVNNSFFFSASAKSYLFNYLTSESNPTSMLLRIGKNDLIAWGLAHIAWQVLLEISFIKAWLFQCSCWLLAFSRARSQLVRARSSWWLGSWAWMVNNSWLAVPFVLCPYSTETKKSSNGKEEHNSKKRD